MWGGGVWTAPLTPKTLPPGTLCSMGMVQQLVALIRTEHSPFHEHVLGALCRYAGASERVRPAPGAPHPPPPGLAPLGSRPPASSLMGFGSLGLSHRGGRHHCAGPP